MTIDEVRTALEDLGGKNLFTVTTPQGKNTYSFKSMTVGLRKSMSKFAVGDGGDGTDFKIAQMGLLKTLSASEFDENVLSEIDFVYLLAELRRWNYSDNLTVSIRCGKCKERFNHDLDFNRIIEKCFEYKPVVEEFEIKDKVNITYRFLLGEPTMMDILSYRKFTEREDSETSALTLPYLYIRNVAINGQVVVDYASKPLVDRMSFIESLPGEVVYGEGNNLIDFIFGKFGDRTGKVNDIYGSLRCPTCKTDLGGVVNTDSFFIV